MNIDYTITMKKDFTKVTIYQSDDPEHYILAGYIKTDEVKRIIQENDVVRDIILGNRSFTLDAMMEMMAIIFKNR